MEDFIKPIIVVTGFGPFEGHDVNASWESVKLISKDVLEKEHKIELVTLQIPVVYRNVDEFIPEMWEVYTPKLVVHVGVSSFASDIVLETVAYRNSYRRCDSEGFLPSNGENSCIQNGGRNIKCGLNVQKLSKDFNNLCNKKSVVSTDAGRYLCEYIYYTSLSINPNRVLFVHVPDIHVSNAEETAKALEIVVSLCLQQIQECELKSNCELKKITE